MCPEELLQKNVDHSSLSAVVELLLAFGSGDHPFGLFTVLGDEVY